MRERPVGEDWEREAENWIAWARRPGHDAYWRYRHAFFELLPPPGSATLEVGSGEGRVARDLASLGHRVTAIDSAPTLLEAARHTGEAGNYLLADAAALPMADASFDLVVAYNSLIDVQDMPATVREASRVLAPGGHLCMCVTHPISDAGQFISRDPKARFVIDGSYFGRRRFEDTLERNGLTMTFRGWSYSLEEYGRALELAGLLIEAVREPQLGCVDDEGDVADERWRRVPMFLMLRAVKP